MNFLKVAVIDLLLSTMILKLSKIKNQFFKFEMNSGKLLFTICAWCKTSQLPVLPGSQPTSEKWNTAKQIIFIIVLSGKKNTLIVHNAIFLFNSYISRYVPVPLYNHFVFTYWYWQTIPYLRIFVELLISHSRTGILSLQHIFSQFKHKSPVPYTY